MNFHLQFNKIKNIFFSCTLIGLVSFICLPTIALSESNADFAYVQLSQDKTDLIFEYGDSPIGIKNTDWWTIEDSYQNTPPWSNSNITKVTIDNNFHNYYPQYTSYWFSNLSNITKIDGLNNINMQYADETECMFKGCSKLSEIDISEWDMENISYMLDMFSECNELNTIVFGSNCKLDTSTELHGIWGDFNDFLSIDIYTPLNYNFLDENKSLTELNLKINELQGGQTLIIHYCNITLTYDANGGYFNDSGTNTVILYGLIGDPIIQIGSDSFNYTPIPTRENYTYVGYAYTKDSSIAKTPMVFPNDTSIVYAVWNQDISPEPSPEPITPSDLDIDSEDTNIMPNMGDNNFNYYIIYLIGIYLLSIGFILKIKKEAG